MKTKKISLQELIKQYGFTLIAIQRQSGVDYQKISRHLREGVPFSEKDVAALLKQYPMLDPVSLRPGLADILELAK